VLRIQRKASVVWQGSVARGSGVISGGSGALNGLPYDEPTRVGDAQGTTSPEELLAAAHAGCFAMALAAELTKLKSPPEKLDVSAVCTLQERDGRWDIVSSDIDVAAHVSGLDENAFREAVRRADEGCPFSRLVNASGEVCVSAALV